MAIPPARSQYELSREDIDYNQPINVFSFIPNPKKMDHRPEKNYANHLFMLFERFPRCMSAFVVSPELTQAGFIHYHGWYQISDKIKYYKYVLPKLRKYGFVKINKIKHPKTNWHYYCEKDSENMKNMFQPIPVPYTHLNAKSVQRLLFAKVIASCKKEDNDEDKYPKGILKYIK